MYNPHQRPLGGTPLRRKYSRAILLFLRVEAHSIADHLVRIFHGPARRQDWRSSHSLPPYIASPRVRVEVAFDALWGQYMWTDQFVDKDIYFIAFFAMPCRPTASTFFV